MPSQVGSIVFAPEHDEQGRRGTTPFQPLELDVASFIGLHAPSFVMQNTDDFDPLVQLKAEKPEQVDLVNHPPHYTQHPSGVECIQITEHMTFNLGNAVKYVWRADLKSDTPIQDLEKAAWYIAREIERLKKG